MTESPAEAERDRIEFARLADLGRLLGHMAAPGERGCLRCGIEFRADIARHAFQQGREFETRELAGGRSKPLTRRRAEFLWLTRYSSTVITARR